ncbi:MAG: hypothetical protein K2P43_08720, partial [Lachnospiraceae bacterium]|nr:hypothetical protein [Lachnospiraceae bacterium]
SHTAHVREMPERFSDGKGRKAFQTQGIARTWRNSAYTAHVREMPERFSDGKGRKAFQTQGIARPWAEL